MLYRGIAARAFERAFQLADFVQVKNASLENGLLHVDLVREIPEAKKPRSIPIAAGDKAPQVVDGSAGRSPPNAQRHRQILAETKTPRETGAFLFAVAAAGDQLRPCAFGMSCVGRMDGAGLACVCPTVAAAAERRQPARRRPASSA